jgi:hypothetical protein
MLVARFIATLAVIVVMVITLWYANAAIPNKYKRAALDLLVFLLSVLAFAMIDFVGLPHEGSMGNLLIVGGLATLQIPALALPGSVCLIDFSAGVIASLRSPRKFQSRGQRRR